MCIAGLVSTLMGAIWRDGAQIGDVALWRLIRNEIESSGAGLGACRGFKAEANEQRLIRILHSCCCIGERTLGSAPVLEI